MTTQEIVGLTVDKLVPGGEGLARHEGRVVFVPGVLPGEEVEVEIVEAKKDFARARLLKVVTPSADRVAPPCPHAGACGGCDWLHIDPAAQARLKVDIVRDSLRRLGGFDIPDLRIETGAPLGYRNRVQVHLSEGKLGFLERGGHGLVPIDRCPVAHAALQPLFAGEPPAFAPKNPRHVSDRFLAYGFTDAAGEYRLARADRTPEAEITVPLLGKNIVFPLRGFFQSNLEMTARLIPYALEGLTGETALDLYAGVGVFGAFLRERFGRVACIEFNRHALPYARRNVPGEDNLFVSEPVEKAVGPGGPLHGVRADAVVVDPPREGLDKTVRAWLNAQAAPRLVYVSCNPVTLARDLKDLMSGAYTLEDLRLFDFYPQTSHIEAVAKLSAGNQ